MERSIDTATRPDDANRQQTRVKSVRAGRFSGATKRRDALPGSGADRALADMRSVSDGATSWVSSSGRTARGGP